MAPPRRFLPTIYTSGTFYDVGYDVGKTFKSMIQDYMAEYEYLNEAILPAYSTAKGRQVYEQTLRVLESRFPHYLREIKGIADGAEVPYETLVLLHMDGIVPTNSRETNKGQNSGNGCSTIMCNQDEIILGHTEDAYPVALNRCYIVHADIKEEVESGVLLTEKFSSLCYAGHLPGFCMSSNSHGFIFSINVVMPARVLPCKTPRHILTRALLAAANLEQAQKILRDRGVGSADGFCVNMAFLAQEGPIIFHSAEVGPAYDSDESQLSILSITSGESHAHCNKYLRLNIPEDPESTTTDSSTARHKVIDSRPPPTTSSQVQEILSDDTDPQYPLYRDHNGKNMVVTIATGIFDCKNKLWKLFVGKSANSQPLAVFPLV